MKLVINIDEKIYESVMNGTYCGTLYQELKNGTPLPKGHGDLIDRQELLKLPIDKANYPSNYVKYIQTIIEKDRGKHEN